jgi:nucleoside-diphosphate-sugar epimerase
LKILVTGATGMIGSELLVNFAEHNGAKNVVGLDLNLGRFERRLGNLHVLQADVASSDISEVLNSVDADGVIHAAAHPRGNLCMKRRKMQG